MLHLNFGFKSEFRYRYKYFDNQTDIDTEGVIVLHVYNSYSTMSIVVVLYIYLKSHLLHFLLLWTMLFYHAGLETCITYAVSTLTHYCNMLIFCVA